MNSSYQTILSLFNKCLDSELDLMSFCEEFSLIISHTDDEALKDSCTELIRLTSDYVVDCTPKRITPETITKAAELFDTIRKTHDKLTKN
ncbi:MAG: hypothetical protein IKU28_04270 [Erysipelotrichaceae bacterium]|nr:hypothetical protein [Erysipelotrichaceae bacterium]